MIQPGFLHNLVSVCGYGLRDPIAYSLLGGGVPYPEHRLNWSLDSVPMFKFLCFLSVMVLVPSFPPLLNSAGFLAFQNILPVSSLFSSLMPPFRPFLCIQPTPSSVCSPIVRPSESYQPPGWRTTNVLSWFPVQHPICRFAPPPDLCGCWYSLLGGGVPYPEHRLNWSLDSVPMFKFICFPSVMVLVPSFSPLQDSAGLLAF